MAGGGRLPRAAGRAPRFLRTGDQRAISLSEPHLEAARRDARHTLGREAAGVLHRSSPIGHRGPESAKGDIPRPGRGRPWRRRGARFRGGLHAAEVADAAPTTALRPDGPRCARLRCCPDCPGLAAAGGIAGPTTWLVRVSGSDDGRDQGLRGFRSWVTAVISQRPRRRLLLADRSRQRWPARTSGFVAKRWRQGRRLGDPDVAEAQARR
jgi:hypothetical protein